MLEEDFPKTFDVLMDKVRAFVRGKLVGNRVIDSGKKPDHHLIRGGRPNRHLSRREGGLRRWPHRRWSEMVVGEGWLRRLSRREGGWKVGYGVTLIGDGGLRRLSRREGGWRRLMVVRWWLVTAVRGEGRGWGRRVKRLVRGPYFPYKDKKPNPEREVRDGLVEDSVELVGFSKESVRPMGMIRLPYTKNEGQKAWTGELNFSVASVYSKYNAIIGREGIQALGAVPSTIHSEIKFLTPLELLQSYLQTK
ncbi:hypothetical protein QVD17_37899 [Tagetes erecta]|uniref:Uncharacterized protein n=1 Tax=Tagetes erecta TaxID=13708 RepID=A0AAD8JXM6_TARER|nr:hypothetical protein QVD17_37899 [Tagetes erecta]